MASTDITSGDIETFTDLEPISKRITGNLIIVISNENSIQKKLNKIENTYKDQIVSKNQHFSNNNAIIFMIFEGGIQDFQKFVVEINSIKEIKNFRYLIVN
jgi:metal-responsive CopG/Arc/MetJ family transcriptional regulator